MLTLYRSNRAELLAQVLATRLRLEPPGPLEQVQVVKETSGRVYVQTFPGLEPISIPRSQITSIEYDSSGEAESEAGKQTGSTAGDAIVGQEVSADLSQKLAQPLSETETALEDKPFPEALEALSKKAGVTLELTDAAKELLTKESAKDTVIAPKTTFSDFLRNTLKTKFPELEIHLMFDKVQLDKKAEKVAEPNPDAASAPAPAPEAAPTTAPPAPAQ